MTRRHWPGPRRPIGALAKNPTKTAEVDPVDPHQIASWNFHMVGLGFLTRPGKHTKSY